MSSAHWKERKKKESGGRERREEKSSENVEEGEMEERREETMVTRQGWRQGDAHIERVRIGVDGSRRRDEQREG